MRQKPILIAGPCMAESKEIVDEVAQQIAPLAKSLGFDYTFKASFDKANRTSVTSPRGPGLRKAAKWFEDIRQTYQIKTLTDIHSPEEAAMAAEVCDVVQVPAFLCRQTDLVVAAAQTEKIVNIKKGQFLSPESMAQVANKLKHVWSERNITERGWLTERGSFFGYGDLVVDFRSLKQMSETNLPIIFDITHSTQSPPARQGATVSGARREFAPLLARAALASGYCNGIFMEIHPTPSTAKSDAAAQLSIHQATSLLKQLKTLWDAGEGFEQLDSEFNNN